MPPLISHETLEQNTLLGETRTLGLAISLKDYYSVFGQSSEIAADLPFVSVQIAGQSANRLVFFLRQGFNNLTAHRGEDFFSFIKRENLHIVHSAPGQGASKFRATFNALLFRDLRNRSSSHLYSLLPLRSDLNGLRLWKSL